MAKSNSFKTGEDIRDAINELKAAYVMFDNAVDELRQDEAMYRIKAAETRLDAVIAEKRKTA